MATTVLVLLTTGGKTGDLIPSRYEIYKKNHEHGRTISVTDLSGMNRITTLSISVQGDQN